jgi:hypothetical protein
MHSMQQESLAAKRDRIINRLRRVRHWLLLVLGGVAIALFPWTAYLSATLPSEHVTHHWDLAWAGFDLFEAAALIAVLIGILRRSPFVPILAAVAGTALLCDAWFDVLTATPGRELAWALVEALAGELPLATLCFWIAFEVSEVIGFSAASDPALAAGPQPTSPRERPAGERARARTSGSEAPSAGRTSR